MRCAIGAPGPVASLCFFVCVPHGFSLAPPLGHSLIWLLRHQLASFRNSRDWGEFHGGRRGTDTVWTVNVCAVEDRRPRTRTRLGHVAPSGGCRATWLARGRDLLLHQCNEGCKSLLVRLDFSCAKLTYLTQTSTLKPPEGVRRYHRRIRDEILSRRPRLNLGDSDGR